MYVRDNYIYGKVYHLMDKYGMVDSKPESTTVNKQEDKKKDPAVTI